MTKTQKSITAWHFTETDCRLRYGDGRLVSAGQTYRAEGDLVLCENGMHGSRRIIDALDYAPGPHVWKVELLGERVEGDDKVVARERRVLWGLDATNLLHEFACRCAEDALALVGDPDPRSINAIRIKRLWLQGKASGNELVAAWAAARDTAWAAAWAAARDAARDTARAAAWAAARDKFNRRLAAMVFAAHAKEVTK